MIKYAIRQIGLLSALKFGFVIGFLGSLLPNAALAALLLAALHAFRLFVEGWSKIEINFIGYSYSAGLADLMNLEPILEQLQAIDRLAWLWWLIFTLVGSAAIGLLGALVGMLVAAGYNGVALLSGGLVLTVDELERFAAPLSAAPAPIPAGPVPGGVQSPVGPQPQQTRAWLVPPASPSFPLSKALVTVGRDPGNDLVLNYPTVAPRHAEIRWDSAGYWLIRDLGSESGTFVQGRRIQGVNMLKDGFKVHLGSQEFTFRTSK
jgi:hypothetical protein